MKSGMRFFSKSRIDSLSTRYVKKMPILFKMLLILPAPVPIRGLRLRV
jgi:hypothetical protein